MRVDKARGGRGLKCLGRLALAWTMCLAPGCADTIEAFKYSKNSRENGTYSAEVAADKQLDAVGEMHSLIPAIH